MCKKGSWGRVLKGLCSSMLSHRHLKGHVEFITSSRKRLQPKSGYAHTVFGELICFNMYVELSLSTLYYRSCIVRIGTAGLPYWRPIRPVWSCKSPLERATSLRSKLWPKGAMAPAAAPSAYQRCPVSFKYSAACKWLEVELSREAVGWVHSV